MRHATSGEKLGTKLPPLWMFWSLHAHVSRLSDAHRAYDRRQPGIHIAFQKYSLRRFSSPTISTHASVFGRAALCRYIDTQIRGLRGKALCIEATVSAVFRCFALATHTWPLGSHCTKPVHKDSQQQCLLGRCTPFQGVGVVREVVQSFIGGCSNACCCHYNQSLHQ